MFTFALFTARMSARNILYSLISSSTVYIKNVTWIPLDIRSFQVGLLSAIYSDSLDNVITVHLWESMRTNAFLMDGCDGRYRHLLPSSNLPSGFTRNQDSLIRICTVDGLTSKPQTEAQFSKLRNFTEPEKTWTMII